MDVIWQVNDAAVLATPASAGVPRVGDRAWLRPAGHLLVTDVMWAPRGYLGGRAASVYVTLIPDPKDRSAAVPDA
jgi:hypothetical protein